MKLLESENAKSQSKVEGERLRFFEGFMSLAMASSQPLTRNPQLHDAADTGKVKALICFH